jgi:hypothetical protein
MKLLKYITLGIALTLSVFSIAIYSSCTKETCKGITCLNNGSCNGGTCYCKPGMGGGNCEVIYRKKYAATYGGNAHYDVSVLDTGLVDSNFSAYSEANHLLVFMAGADTTNFNKMQLVWSRPAKAAVSIDVLLANNTTNGSTFTITPVTVDTFTYSGSGNVNGKTASLNLIQSHPKGKAIIITLSNFNKQ